MTNRKFERHMIYGGIASVVIFGAVVWLAIWLASYPGEISKQGQHADLPFAVYPHIVEVEDGGEFEVVSHYVQKQINGVTHKMMAYNNSIPGPIIKVRQGSSISLRFVNQTDIENTIHSHGLRLNHVFDGVPHLSQEAVHPNGGEFVYSLDFPDPGVFWYHPHVREDMTQELGLYGNFWVIPKDPSYWNPVNKEEFLVLDDILIENDQILLREDKTSFTLMGRYGNTMLTNGTTDYKIRANRGDVVRFYLTNTANTRVFNLGIDEAQLKLVGSDNGRVHKEKFVDTVVIAPSERYVVEAYFEKTGEFAIHSRAEGSDRLLGKVIVVDQPAASDVSAQFRNLRTNSDVLASVPNLESYFLKPADKNLNITVDLKGAMGNMDDMPCHKMGSMVMGKCSDEERRELEGHLHNELVEWEDNMFVMNSISDTDTVKWILQDADTQKKNMDIDWKFQKGDLVKVKIKNDPNSAHPMQHPIHFHGQRFLVLSVDGVRNADLMWKDTAMVGTGQEMEILIEMSNPGSWMAHCHIAEHLESGMMFGFEVSEI